MLQLIPVPICGIRDCAVLVSERSADSELRRLTRERLEGLMSCFRELLKRGLRFNAAFRRAEKLQLDLALKLYR